MIGDVTVASLLPQRYQFMVRHLRDVTTKSYGGLLRQPILGHVEAAHVWLR